MRVILSMLGAGLSLVLAAAGQEPTPPDAVREVAPGIFAVGSARLDKKAGQVTFPAAVNMNSGLLEYLLVSETGPTHESLLVTKLSPQNLHLAMLLLGAKSLAGPAGEAPPPGQITAEYLQKAPELKGYRIAVDVTWQDAAGKEQTAPVEDWLLAAGKPAGRGPWLYTGSFFGMVTGRFLAEAEGIHAALVTNPSALINNPRPGHRDDQSWTANEKAMPRPETPVQVRIRLLEKAAG